MKKLLQKSLVALALFGSADAAFAVERRNGPTNEQIDTRNNGGPAFAAFRAVAQRVNELSQQGQNITQEIQYELNGRFLTFWREWERDRLSEDVVSADEFIKCVTHPVLAELMEVAHSNIFVSLTYDEEAKSDILRHCLGSQTFKDSVLRMGVGRITSRLSDFYIGVWSNHRGALRSRDPFNINKAADRAITALFLTETCFSETVYTEQDNGYIKSFSRGTLENPIPYFLPAQLNYIMRGEVISDIEEHLRMLQHNVEHNVLETMWQNADPHQILIRLERIRDLGLTMCGPVAHTVRNNVLGMGAAFNGDIHLGNWSRFQQQETNLGVKHLFLSDIYLENAHTAQAYYLLTGNLPENDSDINHAVNVRNQQEIVNREAQILERLRNMSAQGVRISDSSALRLFTDPRMSTIANCIVRHYLEGGEPVVSESFLQRLESSGQGMRIFRLRVIPSGVGLEILKSEGGEPFISDDELRGRFMKVQKLSRDALDSLYRQRVEGQGAANQ